MTNDLPAGYLAGVQTVYDMCAMWRPFGGGVPEFWFPDPAILIAAGLDQVGHCLARNRPAKDLVARIIEEGKRRRLSETPTVVMLRAALELLGYQIKIVEVAALKLPPQCRFITAGPGGTA